MKNNRIYLGERRYHLIAFTLWRRLALMLILFSILAVVGFVFYIDEQYVTKGENYIKMAKSINYANGKFHNSVPTEIMRSKSYLPMLNEYIFGKEIRFPQCAPPATKLDSNAFTDSRGDGLRITWLGHSSTIIEIEKVIILTDPVFSQIISPSPLFGPKRFHENFPVNIKDLPEIDAVIISHNHYDHLDYKTIKELHEKTRHFYVPLGIGAYLEKWGVIPEKITEMDWWDEVDCGNGQKVAATPARHFSGRRLIDSDKTLWASWVLMGQGHRVFFSGDSGYFSGFREIGERYGPFDVTMIDIAAYSKYWPHVHMVPEDSLKAHDDLGGRLMLPIHWGTFNLSIHDWTEPIERLLKAASEHNVTVTTPRVGERIVYGKEIPYDRWWR